MHIHLICINEYISLYIHTYIHIYSLMQIKVVIKPSLSLPIANFSSFLEILFKLFSSLGPFQGFPSFLAISALGMGPGFGICASRGGRVTVALTAGPLRLMSNGPSGWLLA